MLKASSNLITKRFSSDVTRRIIKNIVKKEVSDSIGPFAEILQAIRADGAETRLKLDSLYKKFDTDIHNLNAKFDAKFNELDIKIDKNQNENMALHAKTFRQLTLNQAGMGEGLEAMSAKWLELLMKRTGQVHSPVLLRHKIDDDDGLIHGRKKDQVEIDVFVDQPRTILECTSFLNSKELIKFQKFAKIKTLAAASSTDGRCDAYFVTYGIHSSLTKDVQEIIEKSGIVLVDAEFIK